MDDLFKSKPHKMHTPSSVDTHFLKSVWTSRSLLPLFFPTVKKPGILSYRISHLLDFADGADHIPKA